MRYGIIQAILINYGIDLEFAFSDFLFLVMSVVMIAAAGNMINDYFDVKIDLVNRKDKVIVGNYIKAQTVFTAYVIINILALFLAAYVCLKIEKINFLFIFLLSIGALWFYSTTYKNLLLVGNVLIAILTAIVPMLVLLFEIPPLYTKYHMYTQAYNVLVKAMLGWCSMFSLFAFLTVLIREIIKDAEDFEGDSISSRRTLPIVWGINVTRIVVTILILLVCLLIEFIFFKYLKITCSTAFDTITFFYFHLFIIIPLLVTISLLFIAKSKKDYSIASTIIKLVIVFGILYAVVARFNITKCI